MTILTKQWRDLAPVRGALSQADAADAAVWADRLRSDRERAVRHQSPELAAITDVVEARSRELGASALILCGSTARGRRTRVSDLDYHVIGGRPSVADLPQDIDLYSDDRASFTAKLQAGDDFAYWSVWYGCILFDDGAVQAAAIQAAECDAWPDPKRKLRQAQDALEFAEQMVTSGDYEAALEQVRGALSLTARWWLLDHDVFPLSRDEMSGQLEGLGQHELAVALSESIHTRPGFARLTEAVSNARTLTG